MSVQLAYKSNIEKGFEGMIADINPMRTVTGIVEEANGIDFGRGVIRGTNDNQILYPSSSSDDLRGVTVHAHNWENDEDNVVVMPDEAAGTVMVEGYVYVKPEQDVTRDDVAFCRYKAGEQVSTITFDQALTSGSIDLDVDGVALTQVAFNASMAQTMADLGTQLTTDFPTKIQTTIVDGNTLEIISQAALNIVIDSIVVTTDPAVGSWAVDRAYDSALTPGRFRKDDGAVAGVAGTAVAFTTTTMKYDETVTADGIAKLYVK